MRALYGKCRGTLQRMQQKTRDCLQQREDMRQHMEEALQDKQAVKAFPSHQQHNRQQHLFFFCMSAMKRHEIGLNYIDTVMLTRNSNDSDEMVKVGLLC